MVEQAGPGGAPIAPRMLLARSVVFRAVVLLVLSAAAVSAGLLALEGDADADRAPQAPQATKSQDDTAVLKALEGLPAENRELALFALDGHRRSSPRYLALRRLEGIAPADCVAVAERLARDNRTDWDSEFLRENAIATLFRIKTDASRAALARLRASSPENDTLIALLEKGGH